MLQVQYDSYFKWKYFCDIKIVFYVQLEMEVLIHAFVPWCLKWGNLYALVYIRKFLIC